MDFKIIRICQEHCNLRDRLDRFPLRSRQWHRKWFRLGTAVLGCNCYEPMSIGIIGPVSYCGFILDSLGTTVWLTGIIHSQYMSISHWRSHEFSKDQAPTAKAETWNSVVEIRQTPWAPCDFLPVPSKTWHDHKRIYIQLVHWLGFSTCTTQVQRSGLWAIPSAAALKLLVSRTSVISDWPFFRPQVASDFANFDGLKRDFKTCQVLIRSCRRWVPKCAQQKRILRCF